MKITNFLSSIKNTRRILGITLILLGVFGKVPLIYWGAKMKLIEHFTIYNNIDSSLDSMIYTGGVLLGLTTFDFLKKND